MAQDIPTLIADSSKSALQDFNHDYAKQWNFGENWSNVNTMFETFVNKYLFPKICLLYTSPSPRDS